MKYLIGVVGLAILITVGSVLWNHDRAVRAAEHAALVAAKDKIIADMAKQLDAVPAVLSTDMEIRKSLTGKLAEYEAKLVKLGARPAEHTTSTVAVTTVESGHTTAIGGQQEWNDEHHRFRLELPNGPLHRSQLFRFEGLVVRGLDGKHRFYKSEWREFDPVTKEEVPSTADGVKFENSIDFTEEAAPAKAVGPLHLRLLAAADYQASLGLGLQVANWKDKANLSVVGYYNRSNSELRGVLQLGYRIRLPLLDSNLSIGPYYGISSKGSTVVGAGATIELTR